MATWGEFCEAEPKMAGVGLRLFKIPLCYLATVRRDGWPRLHPVGPFIADGRMFVIVNPKSPKRHELARDGRYVLHMLPGKEDEEFQISGHAHRIHDADTWAMVAAVAGHELHDNDWLFEFDIERAMTTRWLRWAQPDTEPVRRHWADPG